MEPLEGHDLALMLVRVGIDADSLCAAGVLPSGTTNVVLDAEAFLADRIGDYRAMVQSLDLASRDVERLERQARSGGGEQTARALAAARQSLASASTAWESAAGALFQAATDDLTQEQVLALQNIHANRDRAGVPVEYLVVNRTDAEWVALRDALAHVRVAPQTGTPVNPELEVLLANANAVPATTTARQNLQVNRRLCGDAFMAATVGM